MNQGRSALQSLKDNHLNSIARTGSRTPEEIARLLPGGASGLAKEMADIVRNALAEVTGGPARSSAEPLEVAPVGAEPAAGPATADQVIDSSAEPHGEPAAPEPSGPGRPEPSVPGGPAGDERLKALDLADGDYAEDPPALELRKRKLPTGEIVLSWPALEHDGTVLYRVVSIDDTYQPQRPQDAVPVAVTTGLTHADDRPFAAAVRHVQVWCHCGATEEAAAAAAPQLHAGLSLVAPPIEPVVAEDSGQVTGASPNTGTVTPCTPGNCDRPLPVAPDDSRIRQA